MVEHKIGKGMAGELCNREACQKPGAYWYNNSTRMYYCAECAYLINKEATRFHENTLCYDLTEEIGVIKQGGTPFYNGKDVFNYFEHFRLDELEHPEYFSSRGQGSDYNIPSLVTGNHLEFCTNIAAYVRSKEAGERILAMLKGRARLDLRAYEPNYIQIKIGVEDQYVGVLTRLHEATVLMEGIITPRIIAWALYPTWFTGCEPRVMQFMKAREDSDRRYNGTQERILEMMHKEHAKSKIDPKHQYAGDVLEDLHKSLSWFPPK